jgi:hypothetical protein
MVLYDVFYGKWNILSNDAFTNSAFDEFSFTLHQYHAAAVEQRGRAQR